MQTLSDKLTQLERWTGLPDDAPAEDRVRSRLICLTCVAFMAMEIICFVGAYWAFGTFVKQHAVMAASFFGKSYLILLLKFTRRPTILGWAFATSSILGIWIASYFDHYGQSGTFEIGAAYTPFMIVSLMFVALIGTTRTTLYYVSLCLGTLVAFFVMGSTFVYENGATAAAKLGLVLRMTSIVLTAVIMVPVSRIIYETMKTIEAAFHQAKSAELARANFLSTMSHEIRTPLHGIIGLSDMLAKSDLPDGKDKHAGIIARSATDLVTLLDEILDMAKLENGAVLINRQPFDVQMLVDDCRELFTAKAEMKGLTILSDIDPRVPPIVLGDASHLRQILNNLVGNAIKFTQQGGVRIGIRPVGYDDQQSYLQIYVQDTGVGISKSEQVKIFERFGQAGEKDLTKVRGTGLGLSICKELIEMMDGKLELVSEPGRGSCFYFTLTCPHPHLNGIIAADQQTRAA